MSFAARLGVTMLFLAPLAFLMGFAFPLGIRKVREEFVPYLWGVNGFFSVVGSVLAIIVSINYGFLAVFAAATLHRAGTPKPCRSVRYRSGWCRSGLRNGRRLL